MHRARILPFCCCLSFCLFVCLFVYLFVCGVFLFCFVLFVLLLFFCLFVFFGFFCFFGGGFGCYTSQQHATSSLKRTCSDTCACCHTEI